MFKTELLHMRNQMNLIMKHHLEELNNWDNPPGILLCPKHGNGCRWRRKYLQDGFVLTADLHKTEKDLAEKLAVNLYRMICVEFLQKQMAFIDNQIISLQAAMKNELLEEDILADNSIHELLKNVRNCPRVPAEFFHPQSPYRPFLISHLEKEYGWIIKWYLADFKKNPDHPENLKFPVKLGYKVRSKSEVLGADRLFEEGILFHYEELILMSGEEAYPDYYIPITVTDIYAWEHCGAMDKEGYFHRTRGKILTYLDHHWFPGINMITTYETRQFPLTEEQVDHQISWLKRCYRQTFPDLPPDESFSLYDLADIVKYNRGR